VSDLPASLAGAIKVEMIDGNTAKVTILDGQDGQWFFVYCYSDPTALGWFQAEAQGSFRVDLSGLAAGLHTLAVVGPDGQLVGYDSAAVAAGQTTDTSGPDASGGAKGGEGDGAKGGGSDGDKLPITGPTASAPWLVLALSMIGVGVLLATKRRRVGA
jgi:LPXTG-motif cell wall-anchored protein